jgi:TPP-dependent pyruvate/acetoin dehydrogenase alpha subunit
MQTSVVSIAERASEMIEEQSLTKEELVTYLRQMMEIRALEKILPIYSGRAS